MKTKIQRDRASTQYLSRHAEPEAAIAARLPGRFGHALVIPAYGERESLFPLLGSVPAGPKGDVLIVVVVNSRADSPQRIHEANAAVRERLSRELPEGEDLSASPPIRAHRLPAGTLLVIDRAVPGHYLPESQGVGLARKIGSDVVLALQAAGTVTSPWIHNTDADVLLPPDYFDQTDALDPAGAGCAIYFYDHRFEEDPALAEAARLYEISLRYYVLGLAWAESPYAYQSMGSCLAIPAAAYTAVRGFPRKNAAEDFYVLDKLAKAGTILRLSGTALLLEGRPSDRVPFGTGRALRDLVAKKRALDGFKLYHPLVFGHLAAWLRVLSAVAASGGDLAAGFRELPESNLFFRADLLEKTLGEMGAFEAVRLAAAEAREPAALQRRLHTWFDAFRTLKLVHALRDEGFPSLPWRQALAEAPFTDLVSAPEDEETETLRIRLAARERTLPLKAGVSVMR
ncbi:MAG: glycosyltransferase family 2 protein [Acidobacteria bacterium]|nr:glycosyltransferase family 2 protein [Acidobacteriota bacterium]MCA1610066.1 glycosyltransferase family 2 protein [Acidobacteriota bacterium]